MRTLLYVDSYDLNNIHDDIIHSIKNILQGEVSDLTLLTTVQQRSHLEYSPHPPKFCVGAKKSKEIVVQNLSSLANRWGIQHANLFIDEDTPLNAIISMTARNSISLTIILARRPIFGKLMRTSTASLVLKRAMTPVLIVPLL